MGPGSQSGHRAQLSPEWSVKDTTACPSPSSTICQAQGPDPFWKNHGLCAPESV